MPNTKKSAETAYEETIYLQYQGQEISIDEIRTAVRENYDAVKKGEDTPVDVQI